MAQPIALVDCNNFYASCERVFQPELRGKPVVILSNNDGCVIARSNEAKMLGIAMGEPWHLAKEKYAKAGVIVRSSNYTLYGDMSARVMRVLADFTPDLEVYSIDEAFLGLGGFESRLIAYAQELRATVLQWTGIPVSVGIAPTKTLAKAANNLAKKNPAGGGVKTLLTTADQEAGLASLALTDLWGVADHMAVRLAALGIHTPLALRDAEPRFIRERLNVGMERMVYELRGTPCLELNVETPNRKSVMATRSFGRAVTVRREMEEAIASHVAQAAEKMRRQGLATDSLMVFCHTNRHKPGRPQYYGAWPVQLTVATADTGRLTRAAMHALDCIWRDGFQYAKAGVLFLSLVKADAVQSSLFVPTDTAASRRLMAALDGLNRRYGRRTIAYARATSKQAWGLRAENRSARFTTNFHELLKV